MDNPFLNKNFLVWKWKAMIKLMLIFLYNYVYSSFNQSSFFISLLPIHPNQFQQQDQRRENLMLLQSVYELIKSANITNERLLGMDIGEIVD